MQDQFDIDKIILETKKNIHKISHIFLVLVNRHDTNFNHMLIRIYTSVDNE